MKQLVVFLFGVLVTLLAVARRPPNMPTNRDANRTARAGLKAADCSPASASAIMDFNNVRAKLENGGSMWQERSNGTPAYEIPKGSNTHSIYSGALWMGGYDPAGNLRLAAITFRNGGEDFFPGPLRRDSGTTESAVCIEYDRFWVASKAESQIHDGYHKILNSGIENAQAVANQTYPGWSIDGSPAIQEWSEITNVQDPSFDRELAPYTDVNGDGIYNPADGDYPGYDLTGEIDCREQTRRVPLFGDTTIYWIFNDAGNIHSNTGAQEIGMEVRAQAFAFADQTAINNMTFVNYVLINQGSQTLDSTYFGQWVDSDLGDPTDDYVGCDVQRGLGYCYNGDNDDQVTGTNSRGYGSTPPAIGVDFFQGPFQDNDGKDNYGPFDEELAPEGDETPSASEAFADDGIPYRGLGIGYGDGIVDNERFGMRKFVYYNIGGDPIAAITDPVTAVDYYNYLRGRWRDNSPFLYGGNGHQSGLGQDYPAGPVSADAICDFLFPGDSDPLAFGTQGIDYTSGGSELWTETTAGNQPGDRRFMQSAGTFTLTPGQVNNITVGVVWARASQGNNLTSVNELFKADDIAQSLFDNCFEIFEGPDAPDLTITEMDKELILTLSNPVTSNNFRESYRKERPEIPEGEDKEYVFEGYKVYQLKDETVAVSDLDNPDLARLVSQSDIRNFKLDANGQPDENQPIDDLINYEDDADLNLPVPVKKVNGTNQGVKKVIRLTEDAFASGADQRFVNNKPYYFVAIAYGYNEYEPYNPVTREGQFETYVASRKNGRGGGIAPTVGIPHKVDNQYGGTTLNSEFGDKFPVTRFEGMGNGGNYVRLTEATVERILDGENPVENGDRWAEDKLDYQVNFSPIDVSVADPLNIVPANYSLKIIDNQNSNFDKPEWVMVVENPATGFTDTVRSNNTLDLGGQELVIANVGPGGAPLNMGIAVNIKQLSYERVTGIPPNTDWFARPIGSGIFFENESFEGWISGLQDSEGATPFNWIRGGNVQGSAEFNDALVSGADGTVGIDEFGAHEGYLGGTWAPARIAASSPGSDTVRQHVWVMDRSALDNLSPSSAGTNNARASLDRTTSIDVVYTNDKSKWTRCVVLEASDSILSAQFDLKEQPSIDKNGLQAGDAGYNAAEGELVSATGMGWFPGYAIDPETGERLNMAYAEDSRFVADNGNDMMFNPTSTLFRSDVDPNSPGFSIDNLRSEQLIVGGRHYLYVFRNSRKIWSNRRANSTRVESREMPSYDEGEFARDFLDPGSPASLKPFVLNSANWISVPLVNEDQTLSYAEGYVPTETTVELRIEKKYSAYATSPYILDNEDTRVNSDDNSWGPEYFFTTSGFEPTFNQTEKVKNNFENIRAVPNPYYAYSKDYETDRLDTRIRITNLPERATLKIFTVNGALIRQIEKDDRGSTTVDWDLKNAANIPVASGTYIIHINMPGIGEHVIKWFGVMREQDLQNL